MLVLHRQSVGTQASACLRKHNASTNLLHRQCTMWEQVDNRDDADIKPTRSLSRPVNIEASLMSGRKRK